MAVLTLGGLRDEERSLVWMAGGVFALASGGAAMAASAADALFLAEVGPGRLGQAVAVSNVLLAIVLAGVGAFADRVDRRRVLASLALASGVVLAVLAAMAGIAPRAAGVLALIGGKQLAAATDLAFWVAIAERVDARRSRHVLPMLAAAGGIGAAVGAVLVMPLAHASGARGVLAASALVLAVAALVAGRLGEARRVGAVASARVGELLARAWRDGARAVRRHPLALQLAVIVGVAGAFASLAYFALGVAVAARGDDARGLAELLGGVRAVAQIIALALQLAVAPRLFTRLGTGGALLVAPVLALACACGLVAAPVLALAIATQVSARALDAGIETPAEKLAQTLLPSLVRGRVAGFLDGSAKRAGAALGGVLAAILAGAPSAFYVVTAAAAVVWVVAATRVARQLPALAIAHAGQAHGELDVIDERALGKLYGELATTGGDRAAELLARLHVEGRIDASGPVVRAAIARSTLPTWRAAVACLAEPRPELANELLAAVQAATSADAHDARVVHAVRALGLAGGTAADAIVTPEADDDIALAFDAARLRLADDRDGLVAALADGARASDALAVVAIDELAAELARSGGEDRELELARHLTRALRRGRADAAVRARGYAALARLVVHQRARHTAELALLRADLLELARERSESGDDVGPALRLLGALLVEATTIEGDDVRRVARALGEHDDDARAVAETILGELGAAAVGELLVTAAWGNRRARDRAAALLAELPVTPAALDRLVDAELDALDATARSLAALTTSDDALLARRLDERLHEIAYTVLLLVAARRRAPAIARAAIAWRHARGAHERARALAVVEAALPRALVGRLVEAVDQLAPGERADALVRADSTVPARDEIMHAELIGRDRLARALALHALGAAGRGAHRDAIGQAALGEARAASPHELVRRVAAAVEGTSKGADMPSRVETLIALGRVPLLAQLTTRQLADVAERARWLLAADGEIVVIAGDLVDALMIVDEGELELGTRRVAKGECVDELACVAPAAATTDVRAHGATRVVRLERVDFEQLVDDVPGLGAAVCRALGARARRAEDASYRSPLLSRG